ncbi:MAG: RNA polymerase subunit sigma-70 [Candidatus Saccharimonadales bacterium]
MITDIQKQSIHTMRQNGLSYSAIANATNLSPNTIKSFCRRQNIDMGDADDEDYNVCNYCGKALLYYPGKKKKRFCNNKCRSGWWNHNRSWACRKKEHLLLCHFCGAEFNSYGNKKRKYCGRECYFRSRYGEGLP